MAWIIAPLEQRIHFGLLPYLVQTYSSIFTTLDGASISWRTAT